MSATALSGSCGSCRRSEEDRLFCGDSQELDFEQVAKEVAVRECRSCGSSFDQAFRYCPWCGVAQRLKIVEYFPAFLLAEGDGTKGLRVSRYLNRPGHVRFSVWKPGEVREAVSISEGEARRLASFLASTDPRARSRLSDRLRHSADALIDALR